MDEIRVIARDGSVGTVSPDDLEEVLATGDFRLETPNEKKIGQYKKKYGEGVGNALLAGAEGALSGATFGLSREIANQTGLTSPVAQMARKQFNPTASTVGEIGGAVGSVLALPGASLPGLVSKGTTQIGAKVAGALGEGAAAKIAASAVANAVEGSVYGAGQAISENALGDPTLTAQKVFTQIGLGGLLGGVVGGATTSLGVGSKRLFTKKLAEKADDTVNKILEKTDDVVAQGDDLAPKVDFGMDDKKILKTSEKMNPKNPLTKDDLDFLKVKGDPDANGQPTLLQKIGTDEIPTLDNTAKDQVVLENLIPDAMEKAKDVGVEFAAKRDQALIDSGFKMDKNFYKKLIKDEMDELVSLGKDADVGGEAALKKLNKRLKLAERLPDEMSSLQIKDRLDDIRSELYTETGQKKKDFFAKIAEKLEKKVDKHLKSNIPEYKEIQKEYSEYVGKMKDLNKQLSWDKFKNKPKITSSNWVDNRIAKPFQQNLPGTISTRENLQWLGNLIGLDMEKVVRANHIYGKLFPEAASASQTGNFGSRWIGALESVDKAIRNPVSTAYGVAKDVITGSPFQALRARHLQDVMLGKKASSGVAKSIVNKMELLGKKGSAFFEGPFASTLTPAAEKIFQSLDSYDSLDEADSHMETLMAMEKAKKKADQDIEDAAKNIFKEGQPKSKEPPILKMDPQEMAKKIKELRANLNSMVNDPMALIDTLTQSTKGMYGAPNIIASMNMTASRAVSFLSDKMATSLNEGQRLPLDPEFIPSKQQVSSLANTMKYIQSPWDILKEVSSGYVSKDGLDVLNHVYPELYEEMKVSLINKMSEYQAEKKFIPIAKKVALGKFLGQQLVSSASPRVVSEYQSIFANPEPTQNTPKATPARADHLNLSKDTMTPLQKVASRS